MGPPKGENDRLNSENSSLQGRVVRVPQNLTTWAIGLSNHILFRRIINIKYRKQIVGTTQQSEYILLVVLVAKKRYQAVGFPCNRMLKLSSSRGIRIDVPVLSVSWSFQDHSMIIQALRKGLIEHEASDTGGVPRWKSSCPDLSLIHI